jgi:hypothetical protein
VIQPTPVPSGAKFSALVGVSCTSASACTAVGAYTNSAGTRVTLAERWDGTSWAIQPTPNVPGATDSFLEGVSCTSASACTAVGRYTIVAGTVVTLAERWDGTSWTIQPTPNPAGATFSELLGVSCASASACTAVGLYINSAGTVVTLAERLSGLVWAIQATPKPAGATGSELLGVSCTSTFLTKACTAVGAYTNSAGTTVTLAERWNGTSWVIQPTPAPAGATLSVLGAVSCTSASACEAAGAYITSAGTTVMLAERWDGTSWVIQPTPAPAGATSSALYAVSCTSASACTAVGGYVNSGGDVVTLAERWDGTSWAIQSTPNPAGADSSSLEGVSCTSPSACTAVGHYVNSAGTTVTLAEAWDGTSWTIQPTPNPAGATFSGLFGVSCTSASACTAVGHYINSARALATLAERWDGTSWTIQPTPNGGGQTNAVLDGVSCTSASACIAVGSHPGGVTLAERWDGTSWTIQPTPNPADSPGELDGVSCTSASACTAVGNTYGGCSAFSAPCPLAEAWDGTSWAIQLTPTPAGAMASLLLGVSCTSASACTAGGFYENSAGEEVTLAQAWDGASWVIQPTPIPAASPASRLHGVSCTSANACTAVGEYTNNNIVGAPQLTLAEVWDGTSWTTEPTPNPAGATLSALSGVSCTSTSACTAVGDYRGFGESGGALVERHS